MKKIIIIFGLIILIISCQTKQQENNTRIITNTKNAISTKFSVIDSLNKYLKSDTFIKYPRHNFYSGSANNQDFGLVELTDTSFVFYQKFNNQWQITDTFYYSLYYVYKPIDLNGDNFKDLIITYAVSAAGANSQNICLLYNQEIKKFKHNKYYDLPNIKYDPKINLVLSAWWGGATHCQEKMSYKIIGDSLTFHLGVICCPPDNNDNKIAGVEFYVLRNNNKIVTKKHSGTPEKMWNIFENAIWNSKDDY